MPYKHLTKDDRGDIEALLRSGCSQSRALLVRQCGGTTHPEICIILTTLTPHKCQRSDGSQLSLMIILC